jgi:hypothetical protein
MIASILPTVSATFGHKPNVGASRSQARLSFSIAEEVHTWLAAKSHVRAHIDLGKRQTRDQRLAPQPQSPQHKRNDSQPCLPVVGVER